MLGRHLLGIRQATHFRSCPLVLSIRPFTLCTSVAASRKLYAHTSRTETGRPCLQVASGWMQVRGKSHLADSKERGAYEERADQHVKGSDVKSLDLASEGKILSITWGDGKTSRFHSVWLQAACFCRECRMDHTGQSLVKYDKLCQPFHIVSATDDGEGCLLVQWAEEPGHTGIFPLKFLKNNCYSKESRDQRRKNTRMTFSNDNVIPRVQYEEVMESMDAVYKWVKALNETGITVMEGIPSVNDISKKICQRVAGFLRHSVYGQIFEVVSVDKPSNVAYTSGALTLHMDQIMYEGPPGIQNLHCLKFDEHIEGGVTIFVDVFQAAEVFREKHPKEFELLCKVPVPHETVHYNREWPVHMCYSRPMFATDQYGELTGVIWHPHSVGIAQIEEELVEPFYDAYAKFYSFITNFPHSFRHRLREGEMVSFNNRRLAHGREAYSETGGKRHLQGSYLDVSEFKSCVHVLSNLIGDGRPPVRVGDFDLQ